MCDHVCVTVCVRLCGDCVFAPVWLCVFERVCVTMCVTKRGCVCVSECWGENRFLQAADS